MVKSPNDFILRNAYQISSGARLPPQQTVISRSLSFISLPILSVPSIQLGHYLSIMHLGPEEFYINMVYSDGKTLPIRRERDTAEGA
jgi:hypothetical protein